MALKDWKKVSIRKDEIEWARKDGKDALLFVKTDFKNYKYKYSVWNQRNTMNKSYTTKAQAIAKANSYMRTH